MVAQTVSHLVGVLVDLSALLMVQKLVAKRVVPLAEMMGEKMVVQWAD